MANFKFTLNLFFFQHFHYNNSYHHLSLSNKRKPSCTKRNDKTTDNVRFGQSPSRNTTSLMLISYMGTIYLLKRILYQFLYLSVTKKSNPNQSKEMGTNMVYQQKIFVVNCFRQSKLFCFFLSGLASPLDCGCPCFLGSND